MYRWSLNGKKSIKIRSKEKKNKTDNRKANNMSISDTLATRGLQINNNNNNNNKNNKKTRTTRR